jgi:hypothetical protein
MFPALLAHPQEAIHKRHLVYYMRVMSVGCTRIGVEPCPSSGGATHTTFGIMRACYVSWLHKGWSGAGAAN